MEAARSVAMVRAPVQILSTARWTCRQCLHERKAATAPLGYAGLLQCPIRRATFSTTRSMSADDEIRAAPEIDFANPHAIPARILPASPSYFTASPIFNDNLLLLQSLLKEHSSIPTLPPEQVPKSTWMTLAQYRSTTGEKISASKYAKVLSILTRLNKIYPRLRPQPVQDILARFTRPGTAHVEKAKPGTIDQYGRSKGVGRRKESSARVYLVEGTGDVMINGRRISQVFPRLHDRESALWALKVTQRMDKYNVFALVEGGGVTGQAESITLALARALLVQEPALKPVLRRGKRSYPTANLNGC